MVDFKDMTDEDKNAFFEEAHRKWKERVERVNEMMFVVLKNHIAIDQFMDTLLTKVQRKFKRKTFDQKLTICWSLKCELLDRPAFDALKACNILRNEIAHSLDDEKVKKRMENVKEKYFKLLSPERIKDSTV